MYIVFIGSLLNDYIIHCSFQNFLARNLPTINNITLLLAITINLILLFHRVNILTVEKEEGAEGVEGEEEDDDEEPPEEVEITGVTLFLVGWQISGWILGQVLYWLSIGHAISSVALLFAFYQLKVGLKVFYTFFGQRPR